MINITEKRLNESMKQTFGEQTTITDLDIINQYCDSLELKLGSFIFLIFTINILYFVIALFNTEFKLELIKEVLKDIRHFGNIILVFIIFFINLNYLVSWIIIQRVLFIVLVFGFISLIYIYQYEIINFMRKYFS